MSFWKSDGKFEVIKSNAAANGAVTKLNRNILL